MALFRFIDGQANSLKQSARNDIEAKLPECDEGAKGFLFSKPVRLRIYLRHSAEAVFFLHKSKGI
jgi:hypothetical protein